GAPGEVARVSHWAFQVPNGWDLDRGPRSPRNAVTDCNSWQIGPRGRLSRADRQRPRGRPGTGETVLARIAAVNIPTHKRVVVALQYIHGIGATKAHEIMEKVAIPESRRVS